MNQPDFSQVTEAPGLLATQEQLERLYNRYRFAKQFCEGRDVVEVACGSGIGLSYLSTFSKSVVGGDIDEKNLSIAKGKFHKHPNIRVEKLDAHKINLPDNSCDTVLLYEAIYYLSEPEKFFNESRRILREGGLLVICTVNKDWKDFHPSPFTRRYFSADELSLLLNKQFDDVKVFGAFRIASGFKSELFSFIKGLAVKMDLIPGSLKLRAYLKRIFIGKTTPLPDELHDGITSYEEPTEINSEQKNRSFKILYFTAKK